MLFSVRINERKQRNVEECKKLAYLIDLHTISISKYSTVLYTVIYVYCMCVCIVDLVSGVSVGQIYHENKINWLEVKHTVVAIYYIYELGVS